MLASYRSLAVGKHLNRGIEMNYFDAINLEGFKPEFAAICFYRFFLHVREHQTCSPTPFINGVMNLMHYSLLKFILAAIASFSFGSDDLRITTSYIRNFSTVNVCSSSKIWLSARCRSKR
jgi:hypothetical protein